MWKSGFFLRKIYKYYQMSNVEILLKMFNNIKVKLFLISFLLFEISFNMEKYNFVEK